MTSTSGQREIVVCRDGAALAAEAAQRIVAASQAAIAQRGLFTLVLSGGSTPEQTYSLLAQPDWAEAHRLVAHLDFLWRRDGWRRRPIRTAIIGWRRGHCLNRRISTPST